mgnify:FL=1
MLFRSEYLDTHKKFHTEEEIKVLDNFKERVTEASSEEFQGIMEIKKRAESAYAKFLEEEAKKWNEENPYVFRWGT